MHIRHKRENRRQCGTKTRPPCKNGHGGPGEGHLGMVSGHQRLNIQACELAAPGGTLAKQGARQVMVWVGK